MNVNFEAIEKAWFKPNKDIIKVNLDLKGIKNLENYTTDLEQNRYVLDELKEYLENEIKAYKEDGYDFSEVRHAHLWLAGCYDEDKYILDKIKELKNEVK